MFTGIISEIGIVYGLRPRGGGARLTVRADILSSSLQPGDSLAVSGACLTVVEATPPRVAMDILAETLEKTNLGSLQPGDPVNLEPPLKVGGKIGGHFVTGHVDGLGKLVSRKSSGGDYVLKIKLPPELVPGVVVKGSIAVEGVSLTVSGVSADQVTICLVPFTLGHTNLGLKSAGCLLNIETDLLGKHVARYLSGRIRRLLP